MERIQDDRQLVTFLSPAPSAPAVDYLGRSIPRARRWHD